MVDFWDVLHDGIYLGMVQKAEISFESVQTDLVLVEQKKTSNQCLRSNGFGMMHLDDPFLEAEARKREEVLRPDFFS